MGGFLWNNEDIEILNNYYPTKPMNEIIPMLSVKRTPKAVRNMAVKLKVRKHVFVEDYESIKYKLIDGVIHKYCKNCERYLPCSFNYFPKDESCNDKLRNVCLECKGGLFRHESNFHRWTKDEVNLLLEKYPHYINRELVEKYFPHFTVQRILTKAHGLKIKKSKETIDRFLSDLGKYTSNRLLLINKWSDNDNPQYNSQRFGSLNPNYKGGVSSLYKELRRNIKQWKMDSIENCNYKCVLTGERFNDIHHLYSFESIVKDTLRETGLELYENISDYTDDELRRLIDKCLEIHYRYPLGVCLKEYIHQAYHMNFGFGNNTPEQFEEFVNDYYDGKYKDLLKSVS